MQSYFVLFIKIIYVNFLWRDAREVIYWSCAQLPHYNTSSRSSLL